MPPKYTFLQYTLRAFGYLVPILIPYLLFFGISTFFSFIPAGNTTLSEILAEALFNAFMMIVPVLIIFAAYKRSLKSKNRLQHKAIIFITLSLLSFGPGLLGSVMLGSASMAVVEGGVSLWRYFDYVKYGFMSAFFAIPLNIILTFIGSYFLYKK